MFTVDATVTSVAAGPRATTRLVMRMSAPPLPRTSWPAATISATPSASSSRSKRTVPL